MQILVLNSGSSSIKYRVYDGDELLIKGLIEQIGEPGSPVPDHMAGFRDLMTRLADAGLSDGVDAIGQPVVHGGEALVAPSTPQLSSASVPRSLLPPSTIRPT